MQEVARDKYDVVSADVENLQRLTTEVSRAVTKLKLKGRSGTEMSSQELQGGEHR